ncbi:MAG: hypothetical protein AAF518_20420 [Spirochaetota bacterium]
MTKEGYYHRNLLGLLDWYGHKHRGLNKLNVYPLAYYKKDFYTHIIPFYFYDKNDGYKTVPLLAYVDYEKNGKKVFLAGTYYKSENKHTGEKSKHLFPVSMQWEDRKGKTKFLGLSYYQHMTKEGYYHRNLLGLLDWYGHKHRGLNKLNVYPLAYYKKDFYTHIIPFYFYDKNDGYKTVPLLAYMDYEKNGKKVFLAGTYYKSENKHTGEKSKHLFPVSMQWEDRKGKTKFLGLSYYQHITKEGYYHRNLLGLLDWYGHKHRGLNKLNVYPLAYYKKDFYTHIIPFYFYDKNDGYKTIPLLAYVDYEKNGKKVFLAGTYYKSENKHTGEKSKHLFPVSMQWEDQKGKTKFLGLSYFQHMTKEGYYHRNLLGLLDWYGHKHRGLNKLNVYPLAYYKKDFYTHIIPFYFYDKNDGYQTVPLLAYVDYNKNGKKVFLAGTYYKSENKHTGEKSKHMFPVSLQWENKKAKTKFLGLSYYQKETREGYYHRNFLGLLDWYGHNNRGLEQLNFYPIAYYKKGYHTHIIPFYFSDKHDGYETVPLLAYVNYNKNGKKVFLAGTYYKSENKHTGEKSKHLFPVSMRWENNKTRTKLLGLSYFEKMRHSGQYHRNFLGLFDWYGKKGGKIDSFNAYPLAYYERDKSFYFLPFYFRPQDYSADKGTALGLLHYHSWKKERETFWLGPYFHSQNKRTGTFKRFLGYRYQWKDSKTEGDISPFELVYKNQKRDYKFNLLGYMRATNRGPLTDISIDNQTGDMYIDTDTYFAFNIFSFSQRNVISLPKKEYLRAFGSDISSLKKEKKEEEKEGIFFSRYKTVERATARDYYGWTALFGIVSYEKADDKRHFRTLPLMWISWDNKSKDKIHANPFYFSFVSDKLKYKVYSPILPLYAKQEDGDSYMESYFVSGFIREYDAKKKRQEYTVLWPLINTYSSPTENGTRVLPFIWHKETPTFKRTITPIYFAYRKGDQDWSVSPLHLRYTYKQGDKSRVVSVNPLTISYEKPGNKSGVGSSYKFTPLLLRWQKKNAQESSDNIAFLYHNYKSKEQTSQALLPFYGKWQTQNQRTDWLFGYYKNWQRTINGERVIAASPVHFALKKKNASATRKYLLSPLYISQTDVDHKDASKNSKTSVYPFLLSIYSKSKNETFINTAFAFNYYKNQQELESFLFPVYFYNKNFRKKTRTANLLGLFGYDIGKQYRTRYALPLYYQSKSRGGETLFAGLFYRSESKYKSQQKSVSFSPLHFHQETSNGSVKSVLSFNPLYIKQEQSGSSTSAIPLLAYYHKQDAGGDAYSIAGLLQYKQGLGKWQRAFYPFYYQSRDSNRKEETDWLLGYYRKKSAGKLRQGFVPFYARWKDATGENLWAGLYYRKKRTFADGSETLSFSPLHYQKTSNRGAGQSSKLSINPLYVQKSERRGSSSIQSTSVPALLYFQSKGNGKESYSWAGLLHYKKVPGYWKRAFYPFYYQSRDTKQGVSKDWLLGYYRNKSRDSIERGFLPFYFYEKDPSGESTFATLFYSQREKKGDAVKSFSISPLHYTKQVATMSGVKKFALNPLYIQKIQVSQGKKTASTLVPALAYYHSKSPGKESYNWAGLLQYTKVPSYWKRALYPFYYQSRDENKGVKKDWLLGYYRNTSGNHTQKGFLPFYFHQKDQKGESTFASLYYSKTRKSGDVTKTFSFSPLHYTSQVATKSTVKKVNLNPLYIQKAEVSQGKKTTSTLVPALAYYHSKSPGKESYNWAGLLQYQKVPGFMKRAFLPFYYSSKDKKQDKETKWLLGYYHKRVGKSFVSTMLPIYYHKQSVDASGKVEQTFISPFVIRRAKKDSKDVAYAVPALLTYYSKKNSKVRLSFAGIFNYSFDLHNMEVLALPFYYHSRKNEKVTTASMFHYYHENEKKAVAINPVYSYVRKKSKDPKKREETKVVLPLLYYGKKSIKGAFHNVAGIFQYRKYPEYIQYHVLPVLYYSKDVKSEKEKLFASGYYKQEDRKKQKKFTNVAGILYYKKSSPKKSVKSVLLHSIYSSIHDKKKREKKEFWLGGALYYALHEKKADGGDYRNRKLLAGLLWKEEKDTNVNTNKQYKNTSILGGILKKIDKEDEVIYKILGIQIRKPKDQV